MGQARAAKLGEPIGLCGHQFEIGGKARALALCRSTATQPLASPRHGRSIALCAPGNPRCRILARVEEKSKLSGVISAATP